MGRIPRLLIGAARSGAGKTLITCALLKALQKRKKQAVSFKCGPDYIDPLFHREALGIDSDNLDSFFCTPDQVRALLRERAGSCEIAVLEGVMGYYDGLGGLKEEASTYDIARITGTPAVLVVVAIAGIAGYTAPSQDMAGGLRIWRFLLTVLSGVMGLTGLVLGAAVLIWRLARLESFGVAYLTPFASNAGRQKQGHVLLRAPLPRDKLREDYLNTGNRRDQG